MSEIDRFEIAAGTEQIDTEVIDIASNLKIMSRVRIVFDSVNLLTVKRRVIGSL